MTLEEQLKREILNRYKSIREFSAMTGIPYSTVDSVLKRGIKNSGVGTVIRIFSFLDIDIESISSETLKHLNTSVETKTSPSAAEAAPGEEIIKLFDYINQALISMGLIDKRDDITEDQAEILIAVCRILHTSFKKS